MSRIVIGDLHRWRVADTVGEAVAHFDVGPESKACRLDLLSNVDVLVSIEAEDGIPLPVGRASALAMPCQLAFEGYGRLTVVLEPVDASEKVAVRRYDDIPFVDWLGDSFTTYNPANFVDSDLDKLQRMMRHNQLRMMEQLDARYAKKLESLQKVQDDEKKKPKESPESQAVDKPAAQPSDDAEKPKNEGET